MNALRLVPWFDTIFFLYSRFNRVNSNQKIFHHFTENLFGQHFARLPPSKNKKALHKRKEKKEYPSLTMNKTYTPELLILHIRCIVVCFLSPQITKYDDVK